MAKEKLNVFGTWVTQDALRVKYNERKKNEWLCLGLSGSYANNDQSDLVGKRQPAELALLVISVFWNVIFNPCPPEETQPEGTY